MRYKNTLLYLMIITNNKKLKKNKVITNNPNNLIKLLNFFKD